tara:strand:- start:1752 stop:2117 length:366 start_codon:yes stop_codon:yes gene_type:complete
LSAVPDSDPKIDVGRIQRHLNANKDNPYTVLEGSCQLPADASQGLKKSHIKGTTNKFLEAMDKKGFALASRLSLLGPFPAVELDSDIVMLGKEEWRVRGVFKKDKPEFSRIELDPALVKGD